METANTGLARALAVMLSAGPCPDAPPSPSEEAYVTSDHADVIAQAEGWASSEPELGSFPGTLRAADPRAVYRLAHRWYLGSALDVDLPDPSSLTRIRQRLGVGVFQHFFEKVVDLRQEAGLV